ncbi:uncharacterized protein (TIGR02678 family) [Haloactinopolyspora alba]|uniref:Uncharacterized protein (TIGR02678 family) n=1 Tax=Haloactinopolyspora alba TaxID=648780 RepID=A0A2P8EBL4_9ACTN|nr:TIGR02678 family protein [Haloactinopolyspora alba]PSL06858.1 uncharacterized protein (TIGR02678 family) [Haloactinopolyspora alba]
MSQLEGRQRAARILLQKPLLRASEHDDFRTVRRHVTELRSWFDLNTGWRLHADSEVIRLHKQPAWPDDDTRPARDPRNGSAFSRRQYVLFCLALAALERADAQIPLGRLAEQVVLLAAAPLLDDADVEFSLTGREQKSDLVAVVHLLLRWGVLVRVSGDEEDYLRNTGDVLYDVSRRVLSQILVATRGPSMVSAESLDQQLRALGSSDPLDALESAELRNRQIRHRLTRRLLDDAVLYFDELSEDESGYLSRQRTAIVRRVAELTGLAAEVRAEGIAMVDPDDSLTDVKMPDTGTDGHLTLLLAEALAARPEHWHTLDELHDLTRTLAERHRSYWRKSSRDAGAEVTLTAAALDRLTALRLAGRTDDGVRALPALARFAVTDPVVRGGGA